MFKIGDVIQNKSSKKEGVIINFYNDRYIVEFSSSDLNPNKPAIVTLGEDELLSNYRKIGFKGNYKVATDLKVQADINIGDCVTVKENIGEWVVVEKYDDNTSGVILIDDLNTNETLEPLKVSNSCLQPLLVYDLKPGDEISDEVFGKGKIISTASLTQNVIEVEFSDGLKLPNYPVNHLAKIPVSALKLEVKRCPADNSFITVNGSCYDVDTGRNCTFLKYINDKPVCFYEQEMNKIISAKKEDTVRKEIKKQVVKKAVKELLNQVMDEITWEEYKPKPIITESPYRSIKTGAIVLRAGLGSKHVGIILSRNPEYDSWQVYWDNNVVTNNWEIELTPVLIQKKAYNYEAILKSNMPTKLIAPIRQRLKDKLRELDQAKASVADRFKKFREVYDMYEDQLWPPSILEEIKKDKYQQILAFQAFVDVFTTLL